MFVVPETARGWILEAICREVAAHFPGTCGFHYSTVGLPPSKAYFFAHQLLYPHALRHNAAVWNARAVVFYTHPSPTFMSDRQFVFALNRAHRVLFMCSQHQQLLVSQGLERARAAVIYGGADPARFNRHTRGGGAVGFCAAFYPRKSPDLIREVVIRMPHRRFILLGRNWEEYARFDELRALPNFSYVDASYADYPKHYAAMDVFVSPGSLEGGPIPLLEAMMSNVVPVASRTGFAPDLIADGTNGFLFDMGSDAAHVCRLIEEAFKVEADVRRSVEHLTWQRFSLRIQDGLS